MNRRTFAGGAIALFAISAAHAGLIDPTLETILEKAAPDDTVSTLVFLHDQVDTSQINQQMNDIKASRRLRHESVVVSLQEVAAFTQPDLLAYLGERQATGGVTHVHPFWISNAIHVEATPAEIRAIADRNDVYYVFHNYEMEMVAPVQGEIQDAGPLASGGPEPGVEAVRAAEVWELGITGNGVLVSTLDTGVDGNHEALASPLARRRRLALRRQPRVGVVRSRDEHDVPAGLREPRHAHHGLRRAAAPPAGRSASPPARSGSTRRSIDRVSIARTVADALLSFEWLLDPDGDPGTVFDVPQTCSNSWRLVDRPRLPAVRRDVLAHLDACEAAGIIIIFAAGNEGGQGLRPSARPRDRRLPHVRRRRRRRQQPELADRRLLEPRPDVLHARTAVRRSSRTSPARASTCISSVPGNGYGSSSGTSMSTPHLNGVVALDARGEPGARRRPDQADHLRNRVRSRLPGRGQRVRLGHGRRVRGGPAALADSSVRFLFPNGRPALIAPSGGERSIRVVIQGQAVEPEPGTGKFYYREADGDFTVLDMVVVGDNEYDAVFPPLPCGIYVDYYFSVETTEGEEVVNPFSAPDNTYSVGVFTGPVISFSDDFEDDLGWGVRNIGATQGRWSAACPPEAISVPTRTPTARVSAT